MRVADPYRWLEDGNSARVKNWVGEQVARGRAYLERQPGREALTQRFREILYVDWTTPPSQAGKRWFFYRAHKDKEKLVYCYRDSKHGEDRVAIDPNRLSEDGSVALQGAWPSWSGRYVAYKLSQNNADQGTLHVRDLDTGKELEDERITGAFDTAAAWLRGDKGFYYTWHPTDAAVPVEKRRAKSELRLHQLGTIAERDVIVLPESAQGRPSLQARISGDGNWLVVKATTGNYPGVWIKDLRQPTPPRPGATPFERSGLRELAVQPDAGYWLAAYKNRFYVWTNEGAARGRIFRFEPSRPERGNWREIVPEHPSAILHDVQIAGGRLALHWLADAKSRLEVRNLDGKLLHDVALPSMGKIGNIQEGQEAGDLYYDFESFTQPPAVFSLSMKTGRSQPWAELSVPIDASKFEAEQVFYASKDGTRIPMFVVHPKGIERDGDRPTLLTGYGGFGISQLPVFSPTVAVWLEHGGVVAVPGLRGGGEYGLSWHRAGSRENKQNVFDDFVAAAQWLISERFTRPERLGIAGGSNGGLLVGAAMTQHPELFRAVVCVAPLLDMVRYHRFDNGANVEYGSAENAAEFAYIYAYSPYHHVQHGTRYPALLMMSADSDDRVNPLHARKFLAAIQWAQSSSAPALLRIEANAGHEGANLVKKRIESQVDTMLFLFDQLRVGGRSWSGR